MYATAIERERAKLDKKKSSKRKARDDSDSDSDISVNVISEGIKRVKMSPGTSTIKTKTKPQWLRIRLLKRLMMSLLRNSSIRKGSSGLKTTEKKARFCLKVQTRKNPKTICLNDWHP